MSNYIISKKKPEVGDKGFIIGNRFVNMYTSTPLINQTQKIVFDENNWVETLNQSSHGPYELKNKDFEIYVNDRRSDWDLEPQLYKIFQQNDFDNFGFDNGLNGYLRWTTGKPYIIKSYQIMCQYYSSSINSEPNYGTNSFVLQGCNTEDGTYEVIDEQTNLWNKTPAIKKVDLGSDNHCVNLHFFSLPNNNKKFLYYRLRITDYRTHGVFYHFLSFSKDIQKPMWK